MIIQIKKIKQIFKTSALPYAFMNVLPDDVDAASAASFRSVLYVVKFLIRQKRPPYNVHFYFLKWFFVHCSVHPINWRCHDIILDV